MPNHAVGQYKFDNCCSHGHMNLTSAAAYFYKERKVFKKNYPYFGTGDKFSSIFTLASLGKRSWRSEYKALLLNL